MKLEELTEVTEIEQNAIIKDARGEVVAEIDSVNSLPPFLNEVEVDSIDFDSNGTVWIDLNFDSNLSMVQHMKNTIQGLEEDLADDYRVTTVSDVNDRLYGYVSRMENECRKIRKAFDDGKCWDYYLG